MATHSYHSRKSGSSKSSSSKKTHSFKERGYSKDSKPSTSKRSSGPKIVSKKTGQEVKREQQKKAAQTVRKIEGTHSYHERKASGVLDVKPATPKVTTKPVAPAPAKKAEIKKPVSRIPTPAPKTRAEQAARRLDIDPRLAKHFTDYEVSTIMGAQSMTVKSDKAREMYKGMLERRAKGGKPRVITKTQISAMDRRAKREQELIRKRNLQEYKPIKDKEGNIIPRFGAVIKDGKLVGTEALKGKGVKGIVSGKYYLSKDDYIKTQRINRDAAKQITAKTNPIEKRRILDSRKQIMKSLPGRDAAQALKYFGSLDRAVPISAMVPTKQETARVTEKLIKAGMEELKGTKYSDYQKRQIVETKLKRKPVKADFKADWGRLDTKLSKGLNLPTESEIAAHRDRTFGKIPGFTKWQADFAKKMDTPKYFHGVNISVAKGFKDFSFNEYNRLRNKPATYGAEIAALFIGGEVLGAVTKGGTIITKAGLAKAATKSTKPMVRAGLLKGAKHLDKMVAAGFIAPIVAEGIKADWENKFKLGKGLLVGGAGYAKGAKAVGERLTIDISKGPLGEIKEIPKRGIPGQAKLYTNVAKKYRLKTSGIFTKAEFDRFMRDTRGELVIERVRERTVEKVKPEKSKSEIEKIKGEIEKNEIEIASKEKISRQASRMAREKENPAAKEMFKQRARETFNEQLELELKNEGLKESLKELERKSKERETKAEVERERGRLVGQSIEKEIEVKSDLLEKEIIKELEKTTDREKIQERIKERERQKERVIEKEIEREVERVVEKERVIEREIEREVEKEKVKEREREKEKEREREKEREKVKEMPPVIPTIPRRKRKPAKLTKKEQDAVDSVSRIIKNQLGDIKSILG